MKKYLFLCFFISITLLPISCVVSKEIKNSPAAVDYPDVVTTIGKLEKYFEGEDISAFMEEVSREYDEDYLLFEEALRGEFDRYANFDFTISVIRVSPENDGLIFVDTQWVKHRVFNLTGEESETSGKTTLIFSKYPEGKLLLKGMRGDTVFGEP